MRMAFCADLRSPSYMPLNDGLGSLGYHYGSVRDRSTLRAFANHRTLEQTPEDEEMAQGGCNPILQPTMRHVRIRQAACQRAGLMSGGMGRGGSEYKKPRRTRVGGWGYCRMLR